MPHPRKERDRSGYVPTGKHNDNFHPDGQTAACAFCGFTLQHAHWVYDVSEVGVRLVCRNHAACRRRARARSQA